MRLIDVDELAKHKHWEHVVKDLSCAPTINPIKYGRWIDCGYGGDWAYQTDGRGRCWRVIKCSVCNGSTETMTKYCPYCGAKMDLED